MKGEMEKRETNNNQQVNVECEGVICSIFTSTAKQFIQFPNLVYV